MTEALHDVENVQDTSARTINLCIGGGALLLGPGLVLVSLVSKGVLPSHPGWITAPSISEYYYFNNLTRNGFVGVLCAMRLLMSAYRGWHRKVLFDRAIAIMSWIAAWCVALTDLTRLRCSSIPISTSSVQAICTASQAILPTARNRDELAQYAGGTQGPDGNTFCLERRHRVCSCIHGRASTNSHVDAQGHL